MLTDKTIQSSKLTLEQEADDFALMARKQFLMARKNKLQVSSAENFGKKYIQEITPNFHLLTDEEIEAELEDYRRKLIEEKRVKEKLSALPDLKGS